MKGFIGKIIFKIVLCFSILTDKFDFAYTVGKISIFLNEMIKDVKDGNNSVLMDFKLSNQRNGEAVDFVLYLTSRDKQQDLIILNEKIVKYQKAIQEISQKLDALREHYGEIESDSILPQSELQNAMDGFEIYSELKSLKPEESMSFTPEELNHLLSYVDMLRAHSTASQRLSRLVRDTLE